jgi:hypothetical protein
MLENGNFYFSLDLDLTNGPQRLLERSKPLISSMERIDTLFMFNLYEYLFCVSILISSCSFLLQPLFNSETFPFILPLICGYVGSEIIEIEEEDITAQLILMSRFSRSRAGTRLRRGINYQGDAANEVELEIILISSERVSAFRLIRGSAPLIWKFGPGTSARYIHDLTFRTCFSKIYKQTNFGFI